MGTRKSRHNRGRKPLYKEHRKALVNEASFDNSGLQTAATSAPGASTRRAPEAAWPEAGPSDSLRDRCFQERGGDSSPDAGDGSENRGVPRSLRDCEQSGMDTGDGMGLRGRVRDGSRAKAGGGSDSEDAGDRITANSGTGEPSTQADFCAVGGNKEQGPSERGPSGDAGGCDDVVRRGGLSGTNIEGSTPVAFRGTGADTSDKTVVVKRLSDAAASFWPRLSKDDRADRVIETLTEILDRESKGEVHKISWWAKWMFRRLHDRAVKADRVFGVEDMEQYLSVCYPSQIDYTAAMEAVRLLPRLPPRHRRIMELLCDGANPVEISDELGTPVTIVLSMMRDARTWLQDGGCYLSDAVDDRVKVRTVNLVDMTGITLPEVENRDDRKKLVTIEGLRDKALIGFVTEYDEERAFGFIEADGGKWFFHLSNWGPLDPPVVGRRVSFKRFFDTVKQKETAHKIRYYVAREHLFESRREK